VRVQVDVADEVGALADRLAWGDVSVRGWYEVADEIFVRSYDRLDINICVVRGGEEVLLVDSRSSPTEAAELVDDLTMVTPPV
jgi:alkyl sulfatase BDS1-like metallo-beta-lactamase superfamily hydrolase